MGTCYITCQGLKVLLIEHLGSGAFSLVELHLLAVAYCDSGAFLSPVLKGIEGIIGQCCGVEVLGRVGLVLFLCRAVALLVKENTYHAALVMQLVIFKNIVAHSQNSTFPPFFAASFASFLRKASSFSLISGYLIPRISRARYAAFFALLIPTLATGI